MSDPAISPATHLIVRGARTHNLKNVDVYAAARQADHRHRRQRLGQVVARLRHDLRRRAAPLRRVAVRLRPPVPRADGEARRRPHRGHLPGDRDPPEEQHPQPALDRRHDDRDSRLHAPAVRARRPDVLPERAAREVARETAEVVARAPGAAAGGHAPADRLRDAGRRRCPTRRRPGGCRGRRRGCRRPSRRRRANGAQASPAARALQETIETLRRRGFRAPAGRRPGRRPRRRRSRRAGRPRRRSR